MPWLYLRYKYDHWLLYELNYFFLFHLCASSSDFQTKETLSASKMMFLCKYMPVIAIL